MEASMAHVLRGAMPAGSDPDWLLRPVADADAERLLALLSVPEVYRFLGDGVPPTRAVVDGWIARSHADFAAAGVGMWLLDEGAGRLAGCVRLELQAPERAELIYALHPRVWGRGLATRMAWTVTCRALRERGLAEVFAGADAPNTASIAVMGRLGMTFLRAVEYPLGAGVEYRLRRGDALPTPAPEPIAFAGG